MMLPGGVFTLYSLEPPSDHRLYQGMAGRLPQAEEGDDGGETE